MVFGERLKRLREEKGINQEEFSQIIKKSRSSVAGYEADDRMPDRETLILIADYFNCTLDYLFGRSNYKNEIEKSLEDILSEKLGIPNKAVNQILTPFNQYLYLMKWTLYPNSEELTSKFKNCIEELHDYAEQSLDDVELQRQLIEATAAKNTDLINMYENMITKDRNNSYYYLRFSRSLDDYINILKESYRKLPKTKYQK